MRQKLVCQDFSTITLILDKERLEGRLYKGCKARVPIEHTRHRSPMNAFVISNPFLELNGPANFGLTLLLFWHIQS